MPVLILCAKDPAPGVAKTRLIPALGAAGAARLARAFLGDLAERLGREDFGPDLRRVLFYAPPESANAFKRLLDEAGVYPRWLLVPQVRGALGERLAAALRWARGMDLEPAVFIGADCPDVPASAIRAGLHAARSGGAYVCPAADGGYALLALPAETPDGAFEGVPWSSAETCARQCQRLRDLGLRVERGPVQADVDAAADLEALRIRLAAAPGRCPRTERCLAQARAT